MRDRERETIRRYLGITKLLEHITALQTVPLQLQRLERKMASAKQQIQELTAKMDDLAADVRAKNGTMDAETQEAFSVLAQKVSDLDAEVGDADGSDTVEAEPTEPVDPNAESGETTDPSFR